MNEQDRWSKVVALAKSFLKDYNRDEDDPVCVGTAPVEVIKTVYLNFGGPTTYLEFKFVANNHVCNLDTLERVELHTNAVGYGEERSPVWEKYRYFDTDMETLYYKFEPFLYDGGSK